MVIAILDSITNAVYLSAMMCNISKIEQAPEEDHFIVKIGLVYQENSIVFHVILTA